MNDDNAAKPRFGLGLSSAFRNLDNIPKLIQDAEKNGVDFVSFQDHLYNPRWVDSWTLMTMTALETERIGIQICVATMPLRPAPVLAKQAMSLDHISHGRLELGIGSGGPMYAEGVASLCGGEAITGGKAVELIKESATALRTLWQPGPELPPTPEDPVERIQQQLSEVTLPTEPGEWPRVSCSGNQIRVVDAFAGLAPAHPIPILIGGTRPRMTRLAGSVGDGWIVSYGRHTKEELLALHDAIDDGAREAGRDPAELIRQFNLFGTIGMESVRFGQRQSPTGSVKWWIDELTRCFTELRMTQINFWFGDDPEQSSIFANEIVPAVRERVC